MEPAPLFRQTRRTRRAYTLAVALTCAAFLPFPAHADNITTTWFGTSGDWLDPANWSAGVPLNDPNNLYLPIIAPGTLTLATNLTTSGLYLAQNSLLTISSNNTYTVLPCDFGTTAINSSQITLQSGAALNVSAAMSLSNATLSGTGTYRQLANTLSIDRDSTISNLVIDNATLSAASLLTITKTLTLLDNTLLTASDTGRILAQGSLTVSGNATADHLTFNQLFGTGTLTLTGTANSCVTSSAINGPKLVIAPSALFSLPAVFTLNAGSLLNNGTLALNGVIFGSGTLTNSNLLTLGTSNASQTVGIPVLNSATVLCDSPNSRIFLSGPVANAGTITGAVTINGSGSSSGLLSGDTAAGPRSLTLTSSYTLTNGARISSPNGGLVYATGTTYINGLVSADHFIFGQLAGTGTLTLTGTNNSCSGGLSGPSIVVAPSASLLISRVIISSGTLTNNGVVSSYQSVALDSNSAAFINNGTFNFNSWLGGPGTLTNNGLVTFDSPGVSPWIGTPVKNNATILSDVSSKNSLTFNAPLYNFGSVSGNVTIANTGSSSGLFSGDTPTTSRTLTLSNSYTLTNGARVSSPNGGLVSSTGTITVSGLVSADHFSFSKLNLSGTLELSGPNSCTAGAIGSGNAPDSLLHITPSGTLALAATTAYSYYPFLNEGFIALSSPNFTLSYFDNRGTLTIASNTLTSNFPILNQGVIALSNPNPGKFTLSYLENHGTVTLPNASFNTDGSNGLYNSGLLLASSNTAFTGNLYNSGILLAAPATTYNGNFYNSGTVALTSAGTCTITSSSRASDAGSSSGLFLASSTASVVNFANPYTPCLLSNATLSGPGLFVGNVSLSGDNSVSNAYFQSITGPGTLTVSNVLYFSNSNQLSQRAHAIIPAAGTLVLAGNHAPGGPTINNASFLNLGLTTVEPGTSTGTLFNLAHGGTFTNAGTLNLSNFRAFLNWQIAADSNTANAFINTGLISFSADMGSLTISAPFYNSGTVSLYPFDSDSSYLYIAGGGTSSGLFTTANSYVVFSAPHTLNNATLSCMGMNNAPLTLLGNINISAFSINHNLLGPGTLSGGGFDWMGGTISNSGGILINSSATLSTSSQWPWKTVPVNFSFAPGKFDSPAKTLDGTTITIDYGHSAAAASRDMASSYGTSIALKNGAQIINNGSFSDFLPSLSFNNLDNNPNNAFINNGILSLSENNGTLTFNTPFYNTGTLALNPVFPAYSPLPPYSIAAGGSASGLFLSSSTFYPSSISHSGIRFSAPYTLSNATLSGLISTTAPLTLHGTINATGLSLIHNLLGDGTLTGSALSWSAGTVANSGGILVNASASFFFQPWNNTNFLATSFLLLSCTPTTPQKILDAATLTITPACSAAFAPANLACRPDDSLSLQNGAQILNQGAFYTYLPNPSFANADHHPNNAFINTGTFGRHANSSTSNSDRTTIAIPFHNAGTIDIQQGAIDFAGGFFNDAPITPNSAAFHFAPNTALFFSGGNYDFGTDPFDLGPGGLAGTGTVHANFISNGTIAPGNSPGTLCLTGNLTLNPAATTNLQINASDPDLPLADFLSITGTFSANGTLNITLLNPLPNLPSSPLTLLSATTFTGTFLNAPNHARLTDTTGNTSFLISYTPTSLTLSDFEALPEPSSLLLLSPTLLLLRRKLRAEARSRRRK